MLDPLNLNKPEKNAPPRIVLPKTKSIVTAITADKQANSIIITAMPYIKARCMISNNNVEIEIPNAFLHKRIADKSYNWNLKLTNQLPMIVRASVDEDQKDKSVILSLKFAANVKVKLTKKIPGKITYIFQELKDITPMNFVKTNVKSTPGLATPDNNNLLSSKPSGTYNTITPPKYNDKTTNLNNHSANNTTTNSVTPPVSSKPVSGNNNSYSNLQKPVKNSIPDKNNYIPELQDLPPLNRPEETENNLLNANDYDDLVKIATSLESENNLDGAIQKYSQAILVNPGRYEAYSALGDIYYKQERLDLAIENYEKSVAINSNQLKTLYNLATTYMKKHDFPYAITSYQKILAIQPDNYDANNGLAYVYFNQNDYNNAIKYYQESLKIVKQTKNVNELAKIHYNMANTYKAQKNYALSIKEYKEAIKTSPQFSDAHYNLAATYVDMQKYPKAISEFEAYIKTITNQTEIDRVKKLIEHLKKVH